jgi:hypothetical protein
MGLHDVVCRALIPRRVVLTVFETVNSLHYLNYLAKLFKILEKCSELS